MRSISSTSKATSRLWSRPRRRTNRSSGHPALHPGRSARVLVDGEAAGWIGELHPRLVQVLSLATAPVSSKSTCAALDRVRRFPLRSAGARASRVRRDMAVVVDETIAGAERGRRAEASCQPGCSGRVRCSTSTAEPASGAREEKPCNSGAYARY